ncbi:MAG: hypothetical protein KKA60_00535 [Proteobacteria bacterium]|nr:hypothetical protein [Pseudomonadota bacterium]
MDDSCKKQIDTVLRTLERWAERAWSNRQAFKARGNFEEGYAHKLEARAFEDAAGLVRNHLMGDEG